MEYFPDDPPFLLGKRKKKQEHKPKNNFQGVKFQLQSMGIQFTILCPARMIPKFDSKTHFIFFLVLLLQIKSYSPSTDIEVLEEKSDKNN